MAKRWLSGMSVGAKDLEKDLSNQLGEELVEFLSPKLLKEWRILRVDNDSFTPTYNVISGYLAHFAISVRARLNVSTSGGINERPIFSVRVQFHLTQNAKERASLPFLVDISDPNSVEKICWFVFDMLEELARTYRISKPTINTNIPFATKPWKNHLLQRGDLE
jgi:hypothetical protein